MNMFFIILSKRSFSLMKKNQKIKSEICFLPLSGARPAFLTSQRTGAANKTFQLCTEVRADKPNLYANPLLHHLYPKPFKFLQYWIIKFR